MFCLGEILTDPWGCQETSRPQGRLERRSSEWEWSDGATGLRSRRVAGNEQGSRGMEEAEGRSENRESERDGLRNLNLKLKLFTTMSLKI